MYFGKKQPAVSLSMHILLFQVAFIDRLVYYMNISTYSPYPYSLPILYPEVSLPMKSNMKSNNHSHSTLPHTHKHQTHSNYEKMKNSVNEYFLRYDQENMIQKFSLQYDPTYLYITFVGHTYRIDRTTL